jgi:hypothetical protein
MLSYIYLDEIVMKFENILDHESGALLSLFAKKKPEVQNLMTLFL